MYIKKRQHESNTQIWVVNEAKAVQRQRLYIDGSETEEMPVCFRFTAGLNAGTQY